MQYFKTLILILTVSFFSFCGGGEDIIQTEEENTQGNIIPLATLSIVDAEPVNGNGLIEVTAITSDLNQSGGDQLVRITGTTGETDALIKHQIDIHFTIYFVGQETKGNITMITHAWGTTLSNSIDGGISVCDDDCALTEITPTLNTLVFNNQPLTATTNDSTLQGTVVYPNQATPAE